MIFEIMIIFELSWLWWNY